jgi:dihydrodipicolinate synthase/N-acetylneuraminate lyase
MYPAPPTPIGADGKILETALRALLYDNISHGADGFWMAGTTGEGPLLSEVQRDAVAQISADACRGRAQVIMHVGAITTAAAVRAARTAAEAGCAGVSCLPPFLFQSNEASIVAHYQAVADAAGDKAFFVYNLPQLTQVEITPRLLEQLQRAIPNLRGLKHSADNFAAIKVFADMGLACFSGNGAFPLPALTMGAAGTIDAPLSLAPWHYAALYRAWRSGELRRAEALQSGVRPVVDLIWQHRAFTDVCKLVLTRRLGVDCGRAVPPVIRLSEAQAEWSTTRAEALGLFAPPAQSSTTIKS